MYFDYIFQLTGDFSDNNFN